MQMQAGPDDPNARKATLIPVAGGKGGIGKSIITANLGIALAALGHETVVVDLDLGGSNLHSYLGLSNNLPGVGDFVHTRKGRFEDYVHPTRHAGLRFLPGDGHTPFLANLSYANKTRMAERLHDIPARYVLLDLGAGSSFNVLDFFSMAPNGLLITTRERPALLGMLAFMKNFILRMIERALKDRAEANCELRAYLSRPINGGPMTVASLCERLQPVDAEAASLVAGVAARYRPRIVLNEAMQADDLVHKLSKATEAMRRVLSVRADHFGVVFEDAAVPQAVEDGVPLMDAAPQSVAAVNIATLAERIVDHWDRTLDDSEQRLLNHTQTFLAGMDEEAAEVPSPEAA